jgi:hypothetical protein
MNIAISNKSVKLKLAIICVLTLLAFLFALFVHQGHSVNLTSSVDKQDCYVCQQGCDTPVEALCCIPPISISYNFDLHKPLEQNVSKNSYIVPQLRAPPLIA